MIMVPSWLSYSMILCVNAGYLVLQMKKAGIEILEKQERQLTEEEAKEFYAHKQDEVGCGSF